MMKYHLFMRKIFKSALTLRYGFEKIYLPIPCYFTRELHDFFQNGFFLKITILGRLRSPRGALTRRTMGIRKDDL